MYIFAITKVVSMRIIIRVKDYERHLWTVRFLSVVSKDFNQLRPRELEVYAYLSYLYNKYKHLGESEANDIVFSKSNKKKIADTLGITIENYYNILSSLKRHNLIDDNKILKTVEEVNQINIVFDER